MKKKTRTRIRKKAVAMILVMAIFAGILPDSFTAYAAEAVEEALRAQPGLSVQFAVNSAWGGSIAAEIILKNEGSKDIRDWKLTFGWEPAINSLWGAQYATEEKESGGTTATGGESRYTIFPYGYNSTISSGGEVRVGFIASGDEAALAEPALYEVEADGENWLYDTEEDRLYVPEGTGTPGEGETETPGETGEPESTPEQTEEPISSPEVTEEPEITAIPGQTEEPTFAPEETKEPEVTVTPEPTEEPEITATPEPLEVTEEPTSTPEPENTATPEPTEEPDYNLQDWEFTDDLTVTTDMELTKNLSCRNLYMKSGTFKTGGFRLTVRKDAEQTGGTLSVEDGGRLEVRGDYGQRGGTLSVETAVAEIQGNCRMEDSAVLRMSGEESRVEVSGDFTETSDRYQDISGGVLGIKSDVTLKYKGWAGRNASGLRIRLDGDRLQTVRASGSAGLYHLDLTESAGVDFKDVVYASTIRGLENIASEEVAFAVDTVSLEEDTRVPCSVIISKGEWSTGTHVLEIGGNLQQAGGSMEVEGGMKVFGDWDCRSGTMHVQDSEVEVCGDSAVTGTGILEMGKGEPRLLADGDFTETSNCYQDISAGVLEIKGDVTLKYKGWAGRNASGLRIRLDGSRLQTVREDNGAELYHLDLTGSAGVDFKDTVYASTIRGLENIASEEATFAVDTVSLEKDTCVPCSVIISKGEWSTGNHVLEIDGDLQQAGGKMYAGTGRLEVYGDYSLTDNAVLYMQEEKSHVLVYGDFTENASGYQYISTGVLEIKGNLSIGQQNWIYSSSAAVTLKFSGYRKQTVKVKEGTYLYDMDISESRGVEFTTTAWARTMYGLEKILGEEPVLNVGQAYLTEDADLRGDLIMDGGRVNLDGHHMKLWGDLTIRNGGLSTETRNSYLEVCGSCRMEGGNIFIGGGRADIRKRCLLYGTADIEMHDAAGYLSIGGSLVVASNITPGMSEGKVCLGGDFIQQGEANLFSRQLGAELYLNGDGLQTVTLEDPYALRFSYVNMAGSAGVEFGSAVHIQKIDGWNSMRGDSLILCGYNDTLHEDVSFPGHLRLVSSVIRLDGHTLSAGWLEQYDSLMEIQDGKLKVHANYGIFGTSFLNMTDKRAVLEVHGKLTTHSEMSHRGYLTAGNIFLWGDLTAMGTSFCFAVSDSLTVHFMQHYPDDGTVQEVCIGDAQASGIPDDNMDIPYGAFVDFVDAQDMQVTPDTLLYYFSMGVADEITNAQEHFAEYAGMAAFFAVLEKVGGVLGAKVTVAGTKIVGEAAAEMISGGVGIMVAGLVVVLMAGPVIKDLYINYGNPNQAARQIGQTLTTMAILAAMTAVASGTLTLATEKEARTFVKNVFLEIKTFLKTSRLDNSGSSPMLGDLLARVSGTGAVEKDVASYLTEQAAKQLDSLPKEVLNKAESILRQYFAGRSLGELEFGFLLRHLDDMDAGELAGAVEWAAKNSRTLANLADDAVDYCYKKWAGFEADGILEGMEKAIAEKNGKVTAEDVRKIADDVKNLIAGEGNRIVNGFDITVNPGKQGKHIIGDNNYIEGRSIFQGTVEDAQKLVDEFAGTGEWVGSHKERVDFGRIIGQRIDEATGEAMDTTMGIIHYSKTGTHIVPTHPQ